MNGRWYQTRTHQDTRSRRGAAPSGGSQFQAGSTPGGGIQPPGERTKPGSEGIRRPHQGSDADLNCRPRGVSDATR